MRVLLTRPEAESRALARRLAARGIDATVAPLTRIVPLAEAGLDLAGVRALLFTSGNGVAAFAALSPRRDLPAYAVGAATAAAARATGFAEVASADGDAAALAALVAERLPAGEGVLLHAAGADVAGDLAGTLAARGYVVRRAVLYRAEPAERLPEAAATALAAGTLDGVLLFSPRAAVAFGRLAAAAGLEVATGRMIAYCLSPAVAEAARAVPWRAVRAAAVPDAESLIRLVEADRTPTEEPSMTDQTPAAARTPGQPAAAARPLVPAVLAAALVAFLLAASAPVWRSWLGLERAAAPAPMAAAAVDLAPIEARLATLERRPPPDTAPLSDAIRRLQADVARLAERPAADPALGAEIKRLQGTIDGLTQRLAATEAAMQTNRLRDRIGERALVAATALRAAAERGGPFLPELEAARAAMAEDAAAKAALDALAGHAEKGVPDAGALARRFDSVAAAVVQAARRSEAGDWLDRTAERVAAVVTVRRVDAPPQGSVDAHVAAAEKALAGRDVAAALDALAPIRPAVQRAAPDWLAAAEARRTVDAATATLARRVAAILGQDR